MRHATTTSFVLSTLLFGLLAHGVDAQVRVDVPVYKTKTAKSGVVRYQPLKGTVPFELVVRLYLIDDETLVAHKDEEDQPWMESFAVSVAGKGEVAPGLAPTLTEGAVVSVDKLNGTLQIVLGDQLLLPTGLNLDTTFFTTQVLGFGKGAKKSDFEESPAAALGQVVAQAGRRNVATDLDCTVGGGFLNTAQGIASTVGGGEGNVASNLRATVAGGTFNAAATAYAAVGGGRANTATSQGDTVAGGGFNTVDGFYSTVGGGVVNTVTGDFATLAGGHHNTVSGLRATIAGGSYNSAAEKYAAVGGGFLNRATALSSTVGGGFYNVASGNHSVVAGGKQNTASGTYSSVLGGYDNAALAAYSFAGGRQARADHAGAFVWGDSQPGAKHSVQADSFTVFARGGSRFFSDADGTAGVGLAPGSGSWSTLSDRAMKDDVLPVDPRAVLDRVLDLPIATWRYRTQQDDVRHMGPMAQDFHAAFGLGVNDRLIDTVDPDGVALAAIQGLHAVVADKDSQLADQQRTLDAQQKQLDHLQEELAALRSAVQALPKN